MLLARQKLPTLVRDEEESLRKTTQRTIRISSLFTTEEEKVKQFKLILSTLAFPPLPWPSQCLIARSFRSRSPARSVVCGASIWPNIAMVTGGWLHFPNEPEECQKCNRKRRKEGRVYFGSCCFFLLTHSAGISS